MTPYEMARQAGAFGADERIARLEAENERQHQVLIARGEENERLKAALDTERAENQATEKALLEDTNTAEARIEAALALGLVDAECVFCDLKDKALRGEGPEE